MIIPSCSCLLKDDYTFDSFFKTPRKTNSCVQSCYPHLEQKSLITDTPKSEKTTFINLKSADSLKWSYMLAEHASGCWLSALGAGMPYNREKNKSLVCTPPTCVYVLTIHKEFLAVAHF